jgi:hypothetical protein
MAGPLEVLPAVPVVATTRAEEDVDGDIWSLWRVSQSIFCLNVYCLSLWGSNPRFLILL